MKLNIEVSSRTSWNGLAPGDSASSARLYTNAPNCVRVLGIHAATLDDGRTVEIAEVEVDEETFPLNGFVATAWRSHRSCIAAVGDECMPDGVLCSSITETKYWVRCEHGSPTEVAGLDFQTAFQNWLNEVNPNAIYYLDNDAPKIGRIAGLFRRLHWWSPLRWVLKLQGKTITLLGEALDKAELDRGNYYPRLINSLEPVRIAQALGFTPKTPEPEPWSGIRGATELKVIS